MRPASINDVPRRKQGRETSGVPVMLLPQPGEHTRSQDRRHDRNRDPIAAGRRPRAGAQNPSRRRRDRGRARAAARALRGPRRCRVLPHGRPALARRRRARPADLYPGPRGAGQGGREHRVDDQPGRDLCDLRRAHAAGHGSRDLDRHAARRRLEHPRPDGKGDRGARRVSGHGPPGLQHRLPACGLGRGARSGDRERRGENRPRERPAGGAVSLRARGRGGAARHLACAGHARHRHASLRGERRVRPRRALRPVGHGAALRDRPALPDSPNAPVRLGRCLGGARPGPHVPRDVLRAGGRQDPAGDARAAARAVRWSRWTWATPRRTCAPAGPS